MIDVWWIGEDLEGSDCDLIEVLSHHLLQGTVGKPREKLRIWGVPTEIWTRHTQEYRSETVQLSHTALCVRSPWKLLQACHCVNEASSTWVAERWWMSYGTSSWLGRPCWYFLRTMPYPQTVHGAVVGSWVTCFQTAGLALTNANVQNDVPASEAERWRLSWMAAGT